MQYRNPVKALFVVTLLFVVIGIVFCIGILASPFGMYFILK